MESTGIVPTMPIGGDYGMGGGSWIFAILVLALLGGNMGFGNRGSVATQDDLNFARLENQVRANAELTERKADAISNGICTLGYTMSEKFAETNANITAQAQSIKDMLYKNKIEDLQNQINQLTLTSQLANVVRYPSGYTYSAGGSPFCNGCGCNNNNI